MGGPVYAAGGGFLYMVNADSVDVGHTPKIYQTSNLTSWSSAEMIEGGTGDPHWNRNIACDQNGNAYVSLGGATVITRIIRVKTDLTSVVFHKEATNPTGSNLGARGMAVHEKWLYVWTGINLYRWNTTVPAGLPVIPDGSTSVFSAGHDNVSSFIATADCVNCGDGIVMFTSQPGRSAVYQYRKTTSGTSTPAGSQLWMAPNDALLWSIAYMDGVVYVAGNQNRGVTIWAIDLASLKVAPVARITPDQEGVNV
jgi:hypothetical protein